MAETAADPELSVADAIETIDRTTSFTEPLRRRAEGVTIALWGLITTCIILSGAVVDQVYGFYDAGGWRWAVSSFLWVPWAGVGVLGTLAIWRIAEVSVRRLEPGRRRSPAAILAWFAVLVAIVLVLAFAAPVAAAGFAVVGIGVLWLANGVLDLYRATPEGRRTLIAVGLAIILAGAVFGWITRASHHDGWSLFYVVGAATAGLIPVAAGLWQALRG